MPFGVSFILLANEFSFDAFGGVIYFAGKRIQFWGLWGYHLFCWQKNSVLMPFGGNIYFAGKRIQF